MCAFGLIVLYTCFLLSHCVTIHRDDEARIISKNRVELPPLEITAVKNDLVVISAPLVRNARYYIYKPSGEAIKLNISKPSYSASENNIIDNQYDSIFITYSKHMKGIVPVNDYRVFNLNRNDSYYEIQAEDTRKKSYEDYAREMKANDFMIGPLGEEDHGNWVLSAYTQGENEDWNEMFRVITIEIKEYIPPKPRIAKLREGDTFEFSFAHPIPYLTSCQLNAPKSTFDRFYERNHIDMESCGYLIKNITKRDQGTWRIIGVGKIVYGTQLYLEVTNDSNAFIL